MKENEGLPLKIGLKITSNRNEIIEENLSKKKVSGRKKKQQKE